MAKTRLNMDKRDRLKQYADEKVSFPKLQEAQDKAQAARDKALVSWITKLYPKKDMLILKHYGFAVSEAKIYITISGARVKVMLPKPILKPNQRFGYGDYPEVPRDHPIVTLDKAFRDARAAHYEARRVILAKYDTLITHAKTWEEVIEVWDEPAKDKEFARRITGQNALAVLSTEVVTAIKQDQETRA